MFQNKTMFQGILKNWNDEMPSGQGFVTVADRQKYSLPPPVRYVGVPADGYSIASLHQYHCLYRIMYSYGSLRLNGTTEHGDMERHIAHCFDYLRQSMQCAGDSALEGRSEKEGDMTDGWGTTHICKSNRQLVQWVTDNRFTNDTGVD
jgi:hypothetical protein